MLNHSCDAGTVPIIDNLYLDMNGVIPIARTARARTSTRA